MLFTTNQFIHQVIDAQVHVGDIVVDATSINGINTNFLASRVGPSGQVLAYTQDRQQANDTAAGLFMAGLNDRVSIYHHPFDQLLTTDIDENQAVSLIIFDYSTDSSDQPLDLSQAGTSARDGLTVLTHGGLLIAKFNQAPEDWDRFFNHLRPLDYQRAVYQSNGITAYLIERI